MSSKTEEEAVFVPVDELEKELGSVVQKLMNELRKAHSRNTDLAKKLLSAEQRNALTEERLHAMTAEIRKKEDVIIGFRRQIETLEGKKRILTQSIKRLETELQGQSEVIRKKNSDIEVLNKHISDSKIYIEKLQSRMGDISEHKAKYDLLQKENVKSLQGQIKQMEAQKTKYDLLHKETVEGLQRRIQEISAEKTKENIEHMDTVKILQAHVDEERKHRFELSYQYSQLIQAKQAPEKGKKPVDQKHKIQSLLLLKQDKELQTELNHYVSELSDEKRPSKLTEEFTELYDNERTDAFDEVPKENEEQKFNLMLKLLMRANEMCRNASTEHTSAIKRSFCTLLVKTDLPLGDVCDEVPGKLSSVKKIIETDFEQTLRNEEKKTVIEIGNFFKQRLSESVEKVGTEIIMEEQSINQCSKSVVAYIQKCMNICWSMCRHVPSMHVDFPDISRDIPFDTNKYKPYTKSGKYVQYIVWPAVYLHEGGPLLCKGIAQGRN